MKITVAGEVKEVQDGLTVAALIEQENVETPEYVTVSVNEELVDKETYNTHALQEG
ncbi:MAG: sulfur carrier protein ThiS, partial [Oscillospiraceae bacterium]|nr:sulfur carrier protein ThiS [Oscillospiraceae bacterium]